MLCRNQKGAAAVEFAIVLPLLLLLVFGMIEFGLLFYNKQVITNASREGARDGITGQSEAEVKQIVLDYCSERLINLDGENELIVDNISVPGPDADNDFSVTVNFDYDFMFAQIVGFTETTITASTVMRMEPN